MILYVDTKILKNNVNPSIKESKKKLNSAKGIVSKIKVPEGFASTKKLKERIPKRITDVDTDMGDLYKFVSKKIDLFTNTGKKKINIDSTELLNFGAKITASTVNEGLSLVKGLGNIAEALLDTGTTIVAVGVTPIAGLSDLINYLTGNEASAIDELWKGTKGLIANEIVNSAFKDLYENYEFGKWLDDNAFNPFKSTGAVSRLTEGIAELAGTALLTIFSAGAGTATTPATVSKVFTLLRGLTEAGKAFQDYWSESSGDLEGKENLVDTLKGLGYGTWIGAWEAAQAYVGADKIKELVYGQNILKALARIGINTGFNAADTPFKSLMDVIFKDKSWNEAWKDQGGWVSLGINAGIALMGSTYGEYHNYKMNLEMWENMDPNIKGKLLLSKENLKNFWGEYVSDSKIDYIYDNKIKLHSLEDWNNLDYVKKNNGQIAGFYEPGDRLIHLPEGVDVITINHEVNHYLGDLDDYRGINEATTEYFALLSNGNNKTNGETSYAYNVGVLREIDKILHDNGYSDALKEAYIKNDKKIYLKAMKEITGDYNITNTIRALMDVSDGGETGFIYNEMVGSARVRLSQIISQLSRFRK